MSSSKYRTAVELTQRVKLIVVIYPNRADRLLADVLDIQSLAGGPSCRKSCVDCRCIAFL